MPLYSWVCKYFGINHVIFLAEGLYKPDLSKSMPHTHMAFGGLKIPPTIEKNIYVENFIYPIRNAGQYMRSNPNM